MIDPRLEARGEIAYPAAHFGAAADGLPLFYAFC